LLYNKKNNAGDRKTEGDYSPIIDAENVNYIVDIDSDVFSSEAAKELFHIILKTYEAKAENFIKEMEDTLFEKNESSKKLLSDIELKKFIESKTWKDDVSSSIIALDDSKMVTRFKISRQIEKLLCLLELKLTYPEFKLKVEKVLGEVLRVIDSEKLIRQDIEYKKSVVEVFKKLNARFDKVAIISGEWGSGKTNLLKDIMSCYNVIGNFNRYTFIIPLNEKLFNYQSIDRVLINAINNFFGARFKNIDHFNSFISVLNEYTFEIIFSIDDLQAPCYYVEDFFRAIESNIIKMTTYDWAKWVLSINKYDQFLIVDETGFIDKYCCKANNRSEFGKNDSFDLIFDLDSMNERYKICMNMLRDHSIEIDYLDSDYNLNISNIKMMLKSPLITQVYTSTVKENHKELLHLCYFEFLKKISYILENEMCNGRSRKEMSNIEALQCINQDIDSVLEHILNNNKLNYLDSDYDDLLSNYKVIINELISVQLARKSIVRIGSDYEYQGYTENIGIEFLFDYYWSYRLFKNTKDDDYSSITKKIQNLKLFSHELVMIFLLYFDKEKRYESRLMHIRDNLRVEGDVSAILLSGLKCSFDCQHEIFNELQKVSLEGTDKRNIYSILYYLTYASIKIDFKVDMINKYLDDMGKYKLGFFINGSLRRIWRPIRNLKKLKRYIAKLILCKDLEICEIVGEVSAEYFYQIAQKTEMKMEDIVHQLFCFLYQNNNEIEMSLNSNLKKGNKNASTVIEYFVRYLFAHIIEDPINSPFELHRLLLSKNYYFNYDYTKISHVIRGSSANEYGNAFCYGLRRNRSKTFFEQYFYEVDNLVQSKVFKINKLGFHFISNTLVNDRDRKEVVHKDFIPMLKTMYDSPDLKQFCDEREVFFRRNIIERDEYTIKQRYVLSLEEE
jgi:hypothetical protein